MIAKVYTITREMCDIHQTKLYTGIMITSETYDIQDMSTKQLVDLRAWQTERLEAVTQELKARVQAEYEHDKNIVSLAKKAGVTRRTVYAWIK